MTDKNKGILLLILSALGFSFMAMFVKLSGDLPTTQKTFFRNLISAIISFGMVVYYRESFFGKRENQPILLLRSVLGTLGILFFFYSIDHLVLSDADMLNKLSPFLLIIFCAIFLKEKARSYQVISIVIAFIGTLFIIKPQFSVDVFPYAMGVLSSIFAAGAYTTLRVLGAKEKSYTVVFYFSAFSTVILLPPLFFYYEPMSTVQLVYLLLAGVFATIGQFGITLAYKFAPANEISIFFYMNVVFSAVISMIIFSQTPDVFSIVGYIVIFSAAFYMFIKNNREDNA
ncbi:DMT family transporter [Chengkuizengella axinellae]|uniref:DMT family transporter n=1 Tax=Chengkuizengella axinellae TaxID=3064388 RepID=A0ABT9IZJ0_9BACL|nr:DMT family transporter [Chengkuizengella sp. 2205SS18-9]MDP5274777.1 DMT family transporter [Chengkuizengella sp. 2205SS18-9]